MQNTSILVLALSSLSSLALAGPAPVVGGTTVPAHAYPDAVAVLAADAACTGTLIAPDLVLTAGHCIGVNPVEVIVDTIDYASAGGEVIKVKSARAYPDWEKQYDVGIITLEHAAKATPRPIAAACTAKDLVNNATVRVVGFGLTTKTGTGDNSKLHTALLPVTDASCVDDPSCQVAVAPDGEFTAGGQGTDACFGDSGGPIYIGIGSAASLIGVVSRGLALPGNPCGNGGVYVRADAVAAWIEKTTGEKLTRTTCEGAGDGEATAPAQGGGCDAGAGGAGLGALAIALGLARVRRRTA